MESLSPFARCLVAIALAIPCAPAAAAVLPVAVELRMQIGGLDAIVLESNGLVTVNGSGGGVHVASLALTAGIFGGASTQVALTDPAAFPITAARLAASNLPGSAFESGGVLGGVIALTGSLRFCLFGSSNACSDPLGNLTIPLSPIGVGGSVVAQGFGGSNATVFGAPWTTATAAVGVITLMGGRGGPAFGTSTTAQPGGFVQLVTPIMILQGIEIVPSFGTLTLRFVPEPATLALLGAGIATLAVKGSRRNRR